MVAIPQWLKTDSDTDQSFNRHREPLTSEVPGKRPAERSDGSDAEGSDIPIFCAGGCGEVVGYLPKEQKVLGYNGKGRWCPRCEAAAISRKRLAEEAKASFTSTDELAGLVKLPRDLRWLRLIQAAFVAVIIAGSVCIAMGRVVGIYLAACGTVAWFVTCLVLWKMRD
jgi:hypothetical protein